MEDLDDAYYDMGLGKGLDVTKNEWEVERVVLKKSKNKKVSERILYSLIMIWLNCI